MNRTTIVILIGLILGAAFGAAVYVSPGSEPASTEVAKGSKLPEQVAQDLQKTLVRFHSPVIGPVDAPVTIVEFFDPSCEACRAFYPIVKEIMSRYPEQVRLVLRYALFHRGSEEVARMLEAARRQNLYVPVLEAVLRVQPAWHDDPAVTSAWQAAEEAGLDIEQARQEMQAENISSALQVDMQDIKNLGIRGTPTFFVNGRELTEFGGEPLLRLVEEEVQSADQ